MNFFSNFPKIPRDNLTGSLKENAVELEQRMCSWLSSFTGRICSIMYCSLIPIRSKKQRNERNGRKGDGTRSFREMSVSNWLYPESNPVCKQRKSFYCKLIDTNRKEKIILFISQLLSALDRFNTRVWLPADSANFKLHVFFFLLFFSYLEIFIVCNVPETILSRAMTG